MKKNNLLLFGIFNVLFLSLFYTSSAQVSGLVFRDFNASGVRDSSLAFFEPRVSGIMVKAYNKSGTLLDSTLTDAFGNYSFTSLGLPLRIEFTGLGASDFSAPLGAGNSSSVQFYTSTSTAANFALSYPGDYVQANPKIACPVMKNGASTSSVESIRTWNYDNSGLTNTTIQSQNGTVYGLAYSKSTKNLYSSAYVKRHTGLKDLNNDGNGDLANIYVTNTVSNATSLWLDASTLSINFGTIPNDAGRGLAGTATPNRDPEGFNKTAKVGIGDIELSDDEQTLYLTNLFDKKLYAIDVATKTLINSWVIPQSCSNGDVCNFGLKYYRGNLFIGQACTGETSQLDADLSATVYKFDGSTFTSVLQFPLTYTKGAVHVNFNCGNTKFYPWTNDMATIICTSNFMMYPQAILSDIEFDAVTGNMLIGIRDRTGDQVGMENFVYPNPAQGNALGEGFSGGDILAASMNPNGTFTLESNGAVNGVNGSGVNNNQGPGGGEFFASDIFGNHREIAQGALASAAGYRTTISTIMDPLAIQQGGITHFDNRNGADANRLVLYTVNSPENFGKANGLGDIELLSDPAPIEIGNRVWEDVNKNGIQDAGENGLDGIVIQLYEGANLVGTTTTLADGSYVFNTTNVNQNGATGIKPFTNYTIRIQGANLGDGYRISPANADASSNGDARDNDAMLVSGNYDIAYTSGNYGQNDHTLDFGFQVNTCIGNYVWNDINQDGLQNANEVGVSDITVVLMNGATNATLATSKTDAYGFYQFCNLSEGNYKIKFILPTNYVFTSANNNTSDSLDSDPSTSNGITIGYFIARGDSNMTVDGGIYEQLPANSARVGDKVWFDTDGDGTQDPNEPGVSGVTVGLYTCANQTTPVRSTITDADGNYFFEKVAPGSYSVGITLPLGMVYTQQSGVITSETNSDIITSTERTTCFTVNPGNNILYVDAGLVAKPSTSVIIGNRVWRDNNQDGLQDPTELGVPGIGVTLYDQTGINVLGQTTTDVNGYYIFNGYPSGSYIVGFDLPSGNTFSPQSVGTDSTVNSKANTSTGRTPVFSIADGQMNLTLDAGIFNPLTTNSIGDRVWYDADKDGIQDATEYGYPGVNVTLYDCVTNAVIAVTNTDFEGQYAFSSLANGSYYVGFGPVAGYQFTGANADLLGITGIGNSDANPSTGLTSCVNLSGNTHITYLDAGIYPGNMFSATSTLGDLVWMDLNGNGLQDSGEPGRSGITVSLLDTNNVVLKTTLTDGLGNYIFTGLSAGAYKVQFSNIPSGHTFSPKVGATSVLNNSDVLFQTGRTEIVFLAEGEDKLFVDAGIVPTGTSRTLGDYVWIDLNQDGIQDANEPPLAGVTVDLYSGTSNTVLATTTTNSEGKYLFTGLTLGLNYSVGFKNLPPGYVFTVQNGGINVTNNSDADPVTGRTGNAIMSGTTNLNFDAGVYSTTRAVIGNYTWSDEDKDGIQDPNEPAIPGVLVTLYDNNNMAIASSVTDANGKYLFNNVLPGTYTIGFSGYPTTMVPTTKGTNPSADDDSNVDPLTSKTSSFTVAAGDVNLTLDAGFVAQPNAGLGNYVWLDDNADGLQDPSEKSLPNTVVTLYGSNGTSVLSTTVTNDKGQYSFFNLTAGDYVVGFVYDQVGYSPTAQTGQLNDPLNNDMSPDGKTSSVTLLDGTYNPNVDAGFKYSTNCIGDYVWNDVNQDGIQNGTELGVAGITVSIYDATNNALVSVTQTDAYGAYEFCELPAGSYKVKFTLPPNYAFTVPNIGNNTTDSDPNPSTGFTSTITLVPGMRITTVDAGIYEPKPLNAATIGDKVWFDNDGDGVQDPNESGISGIVVTLYNCTNPTLPVRSTVTNAYGNYLFENITAGNYSVQFSVPVGFVFTSQNGAITDTSNSDVNVLTERTACFTVNTGDQITYVDAGLKTKTTGDVTIGDRVWNDLDQDGIQDPNEPGLGGVVVTLYDNTGLNSIKSTTTDPFGNYTFNGYPAGCYVIGFSLPSGYTRSPQNVGTDSTRNSDASTSTGKTNVICIASNQTNTSIDAGMYNSTSTNTIGDRVWLDEDRDGMQDPGEVGQPGVVVTLYNCSTNDIVAVTTTNTNGNYSFDGIANGSYYVGFGFEAGYQFTSGNADLSGITGTSNSDADPSTGLTSCVTVSGNTTIDYIDAGVHPGNSRTAKSSIGDRVWVDANADGIQNNTEPGLSGITVELLDVNNVVLASTITDGIGNYIFTNLDGGLYKIKFSDLPSGFSFTSSLGNLDDENNSDANTTTGITGVIGLALGDDMMSIDAGLIPPANTVCLGDYVWIDLNHDGVQDANEPGMSGITVKLYDGNTNTVLGVSTTDENGKYLFCGLSNGNSYSVAFENLPTGYIFTSQSGALSLTNNSDANPLTGRTSAVVLGSTNDLSIDAGLYSTTKGLLGDFVWFDENSNGIQDLNESPIPGVLVTLYDNNNIPVTSSITDANGNYLFTNVQPGSYSIEFSGYPKTLVPTIKGVTPNATNDSKINTATSRTDLFTVTAGSSNLTMDAGFKPNPLSGIGNYVWIDANENGFQDASEPGLSGVLVTLYASDGVTPISTSITDGTGAYSFPALESGDYIVGFSNVPNGMTRTKVLGGINDPLNSDIDGTNKTSLITLVPGVYNSNIDAGFYFGVPLPARELTATTAIIKTAGQCEVSWFTLVEENTNRFDIERSQDGVSFSKVGELNAMGQTNGRTDYRFNDNIENVEVGSMLYYRIRMTDIDNKSMLSNTLTVKVNDLSGDFVVEVYPNPFTSSLSVSCVISEASDVQVELLDLNGRMIQKSVRSLESGYSTISLRNVEQLSHGSYYVRFSNLTTGETSVRKVVK